MGWHWSLAGDQALFGAGVTEVGCIAHARRKFFEWQLANQSLIAGAALPRISELYEIESRGRNLANAAHVKLLVASSMQPMADYLRRPNAL